MAGKLLEQFGPSDITFLTMPPSFKGQGARPKHEPPTALCLSETSSGFGLGHLRERASGPEPLLKANYKAAQNTRKVQPEPKWHA